MNTPFGWDGTSLRWIRLLLWKEQVCIEFDFSIKKYKFAVNTTFVWTVLDLQMNTTFLWKVQVCSEYDFC